PVYPAGRGGEYTYHGPGQRVVYVMLDLSRRRKDVRCFVATLERWIFDTLATFGVTAETRSGRTGVWVTRPDKGAGVEEKIAAIGLRVRRWVSFHGISINVYPNLEHYRGIVACGIHDQGVTSLKDLGYEISMSRLDMALSATFSRHFGRMDKSSTGAELPSMVSHER
ncbi:MAG: lipoyl(octanoyl) transferase LipB, partial [Alphaproteobacteria bacterium]